MTYMFQKCFDVALRLVEEAGQLVRSRIWSSKSVNTKSSNKDFVTETDQEVEDLLIHGINCAFVNENFKFIGEESAFKENKPISFTDDPTWIIDPIDGTSNFVHGNPHVAISVGFYNNRSPEFGIIYMPVFEQMFSAITGHGAKLNDRQIKVSGVKDIHDSLMCLQCAHDSYKGNEEFVLHNFKSLFPLIHGVRSYGTAAYGLATVALGATDAYLEFGPHIWDVAAANVIIIEAGGVVVDPTGGPLDIMSRRFLAASSSELAQDISNRIHHYCPPRDDE